MTFGIPSLLEFADAERHLQFCVENGFDFFEMNLSFPQFQSDKIDAENLARLGKKFGANFTLHLHDQLNPLDFSPEIRAAAFNSMEFALALAEKIDAKTLTMHLIGGMYSSIDGEKKYAYEMCKDEYLRNVRAFVDFVKRNLPRGATFCIENTSGFLPFQKDAIDLMLAEDCFGLTFDIGHNYKAGGGDEPFILARAEKLRHFHIHDVREKGNHFALGKGVLDIPRYLRMAENFGCAALIEVKESSALLESKKYLKTCNFWK